MKKRIYISVIIAVMLLVVVVSVNVNPAFVVSEHANRVMRDIPKGNSSSLFNGIESLGGDNQAVYLVISRDDISGLPEYMPRRRLFKTTDKAVIKRLKYELFFTASGGDIATVTSEMIFVDDGKISFHTGIVLQKDMIGIQNGEFGWATVDDAKSADLLFRSFKPIYLPIIFI